jgi:hypothetical protein
VLRTRSTQPRSTSLSIVTAMFGGEMSSAWPSCFWLTFEFDATSTSSENSEAFSCSGPSCFAKTFFSSIAARLAA